MNILEPSANPVLLGHDVALEQINSAFSSGRMPHAWLILGAEGIGKATLAYHMANLVLSEGRNRLGKLDMNHPAAKLIAAEAHPDLFVLRRPLDEKTGERKSSIPVDEARKMAPFLHMTSTQGGWRVAIIDGAQDLNRHGQNAILKVIEEPPEKCLIVITATTSGALLSTIRSRCRLLSLSPLEDDILRAVLMRCDVDLTDMDRLLQLSSGSAGFALKLLGTDCLSLYEELLALLQKLPELNMAELHTLADRLGRKADKDSFAVIAQLLMEILQNTVRAQASGRGEGIFVENLAQRCPLDRALQLWDKVRQIFTEAETANLDKKLAFVNVVTEIRRALQ